MGQEHQHPEDVSRKPSAGNVVDMLRIPFSADVRDHHHWKNEPHELLSEQ